MKPILFNAQMVRAILDGRKTQTRRIIKAPVLYRVDTPPDVIAKAQFPKGYWDFIWHGKAVGSFTIRPPYQPGDVLYVRETWTSENGAFYYRADFASDFLDPCETLGGGYPGDCAYHPGCEGCARGPQRIRWRPSIHMPKEAARLFLRVTNVRVERLQDINTEDIKAEGITVPHGFPPVTPYSRFADLWDSTIKLAEIDRFGWNANPWVWVYTFERCGKEGESWNG